MMAYIFQLKSRLAKRTVCIYIICTHNIYAAYFTQSIVIFLSPKTHNYLIYSFKNIYSTSVIHSIYSVLSGGNYIRNLLRNLKILLDFYPLFSHALHSSISLKWFHYFEFSTCRVSLYPPSYIS